MSCFWYVPVRTGTYWTRIPVLACTGMYQYVPVHSTYRYVRFGLILSRCIGNLNSSHCGLVREVVETSGILAPWIRIIILVYTSICKYIQVYTLYTCISVYIHIYAKNILHIQVYTSTCYQNFFQTGAQFHDVSVSSDTYPMQCMTY